MHAQQVGLEVTEAAKEWLAEQGYQPEFGARPLRRTIQTELDNRLSNMLLDGQVGPGDTVTCDVRDGQLECKVTPGVGRKAPSRPQQADHGRLVPVEARVGRRHRPLAAQRS